MQAQVEQLTRDMVRARANTGTTTTPAYPTMYQAGKNPPPESVEGLVKTVEPSSGMMTLTIGSDAGLARGHTLEVFRLSSIPAQSKYLGTVRVLEATAHQAVVQPVGRLAGPAQPGDQVSSQILGR